MENILQSFKDEIEELFKAYRMAHFSLYNMKSTYYNFKISNPEIENFVLEDEDFNNLVRFNEKEINKNSEGGSYQRIIAGSTIAMFFNIWEDKYRKIIAEKVGVKKDDIKSDFFAELRLIRQSVTHNNFQAIRDLKRLDKLSFVGDPTHLKLSSFEVQKIYEELVKEIDQIASLYSAH